MNDQTIKTRLIQLLDEINSERSRLVDSLSEAERTAQGAIDHWAFKDLLFHLAYWMGLQAERLAAQRRGEVPPQQEDFLKINDRVFLENQERSLQQALDQVFQAAQQLRGELGYLSDEDLHSVEKFPWTGGQPLYRHLFGDIYSHPLSHLAGYQVERGNLAEARRLSERLAEVTVVLDDTPRSHGAALYNLACFHALIGESEQALALLEQAFPLAPSLRPWAKEDTDLVSLRGMAGFEALTAEEPKET